MAVLDFAAKLAMKVLMPLLEAALKRLVSESLEHIGRVWKERILKPNVQAASAAAAKAESAEGKAKAATGKAADVFAAEARAWRDAAAMFESENRSLRETLSSLRKDIKASGNSSLEGLDVEGQKLLAASMGQAAPGLLAIEGASPAVKGPVATAGKRRQTRRPSTASVRRNARVKAA